VHLVFISLCASILALCVNSIVGYELANSFSVTPTIKTKRVIQIEKEDRDFSIVNDRNLFGSKRESVVPVDAEADETASSGRWEDAVPTSLRVRLISTAVFLNPQFSTALIADLRQGGDVTAVSYSINDCSEEKPKIDPLFIEILGPSVLFSMVPCNRLLGVGIIKRIEVTRVYFFNEQEKKYEYLMMDEGLAPIFPAPTSSPMSAPAGAAEYGKSVRKVGANSYEIDANDLDAALGNLSEISTQARMVAAFENGKSIGFRVLSMKPGSVFEKIGLQNGDIVTSINGYPLSGPDKVLELYQKAKTSSQFSLGVKSSGASSSTTLNYSILGRP
jgi:type II secretory pathway component PulC